MFKLAQSHYSILINAIFEAEPWARYFGVFTYPALEFAETPRYPVNDPMYLDDVIHFEIDEPLLKNLIEVLAHHPDEEKGDYFIKDLQDLFDN